MSLELAPKSYGAYFFDLTFPERLAVERYIDAMVRLYPEIASEATAGPGNDGAVYVYIPFPDDDDLDIEVHETLAEVSADILLSMGISIVLRGFQKKSSPDRKELY